MKKLKSLFIIGIVVLASGAVYLTACRKKVIEPKPIKQSYFTAKVNGVECNWQIYYGNWITNLSVTSYIDVGGCDITVNGSHGPLIISLSNSFEEPFTYVQDTTAQNFHEPFYITYSPSMEIDPDPYCSYGPNGNNVGGYRSFNMLRYYWHYGFYPDQTVVPQFHLSVNNSEVIEGSFNASMLNSCFDDSTDLGIITITDAKFKFYRKDFETTDPF